MDDSPKQKPAMRGIYLLPNLFTVAGLFAGFYAIVAGMKQEFTVAAVSILLAILLDGLDGRIARLTHSQSEFGAQMDSLSDMVSFGVAPALVLYNWSLMYLGKLGWLAAFIYAVCTALRLARFNLGQSPNKRYFQGLATPAAAGMVASMIWTMDAFSISGLSLSWLVLVITVGLGLLKVSTIHYRSFKDLDMRGKVPFIAIIVIVLTLVFVSYDPPRVLFVIASLYVLSGPVMSLWNLLVKFRGKK